MEKKFVVETRPLGEHEIAEDIKVGPQWPPSTWPAFTDAFAATQGAGSGSCCRQAARHARDSAAANACDAGRVTAACKGADRDHQAAHLSRLYFGFLAPVRSSTRKP